MPSTSVSLPRRDSALRRLGVTKAQLKVAPNISSILKETRGGVKLALKAMRFSDSPLIQSFIEKYDSISARDRESLPLEAIAIAAGLNIAHFWGEVVLAMRERSLSAVKIIAIANHPQLIRKRVEFAKQPGGYRDRDKMDEMLGVIKTPHGATFIDKIFVSKPQDEKGEEDEGPEEVDNDLDYVFPDCSEVQGRIQTSRQKMLESGK